jgi:hypothetical protein
MRTAAFRHTGGLGVGFPEDGSLFLLLQTMPNLLD